MTSSKKEENNLGAFSLDSTNDRDLDIMESLIEFFKLNSISISDSFSAMTNLIMRILTTEGNEKGFNDFLKILKSSYHRNKKL